MNRTDRLLAIVLELQGKKRQRSEDLAATFEVSKRTIYRDIEALCEMGVPVVSVPGQGYSLVDGYFLPPLRFTTDEALMMLLGIDFVARSFDSEYRLAAESARRKIEGVLPDGLRREVQSLQESIRFVVLGDSCDAVSEESLQQIRRAIVKRQTVAFDYDASHLGDGKGEWVSYEADPYGLVSSATYWYMVAYCHQRQGIFNFRVERMKDLRFLQTSFTRPPDFKLADLEDQQRDILAHALLHDAAKRWSAKGHSLRLVSQEDPE
jgi:predicted DNA-binding transcriptional regulator YafY